ncbi:hypothetical protein PINS_up016558 [Pythium insidiosum]|nr:hypothetical protein PINS_up016558 [Pythium insidiosum]
MTRWLLQQPGTWSGAWDTSFFAFLLEHTPEAVLTYLDHFATELSHSKKGLVGIKYSALKYIYGEPHLPVEDTALALIVKSPNARDILSHRAVKYVMKAKWKAFAKAKFRREFIAYLVLLVSYFVPTVWADPDWTMLVSNADYLVACSRAISWLCSLYLLLAVERNECIGDSVRSYFGSFWNWLNVVTYAATLISIPFEFTEATTDIRNSLLALITVSLWVNLLQFLQVSTKSGLLIAMMTHMVSDVYRFLLLYVVFLFGYSGAFYILVRGSTGYENFVNSFITVFLMLFGAIDYTVFNDKSIKGWRWHMGNFLLITHLIAVVIVLLNILIAMMTTTYENVWEAAEAEALQSHAQAIVRMEKSVRPHERIKTFEKLLQRAEPSSKETKTQGNPGSFGLKTATKGSEVLLIRSSNRRELNEGILTRLKQLPLTTDAGMVIRRAVNAGMNVLSPRSRVIATSVKQKTAVVHPSPGPTTPIEKIPKTDRGLMNSPRDLLALPGQVLNPTALIENLIEAPTMLEQTLFLKSAFDQDDSGPDNATPLAMLEDGIRYEVPIKKSQERESERMMREMQSEITELHKTVAGLKTLIETSSLGTSSARERAGEAATALAFAKMRSPRRSFYFVSRQNSTNK